MSTTQTESKNIDLTVFNEIYTLNQNCFNHKSCVAIYRLLISLRYYSSFNLNSNQDDQNLFINFINEVYKHHLLIQDFHHLQNLHGEHINDIMEYNQNKKFLTECTIQSCNFASRHYRIMVENSSNDKICTNTRDPYLNIYCDTMDSLHYYLCHLFQAGLRYDRNSGKNMDLSSKDNQQIDFDNCYDAEFERIGNSISKTQKASNRFKRISSGTKFNIEVNEDVIQDMASDDEENDGITYIDSVFNQLVDHNIDQQVWTRLMKYLKIQEFDTESMDLDLKMMTTGNISEYMVDHQDCLNFIFSMFNQSPCVYTICE